ncbi:MAG: polysaccharide pyruvyl transferase family protein [Alphaproteobacteria bacterium]|nr:polysaccharide pyruvyl transferase family protein [Alphaproteobacteria bacterium]
MLIGLLNGAHASDGDSSTDPAFQQKGFKEKALSLFDEAYYLEQSGKHHHIWTSKKKVFKDYLKEGWQKHNPNKWFDNETYKKFFPCGARNPFIDWLSQPTGVRELNSGDPSLIISLTTYPPRKDTAWLAVESILRQTLKPHTVVVWVAKDDLAKMEIPKSLEVLQARGVEIRISEENYRAATKYIPSLKEFPDANIVTIDDDRFYASTLLEMLWQRHTEFPNCIISPAMKEIRFSAKRGGIDYLLQDTTIVDPTHCSPYDHSGDVFKVPGFYIFEGFRGVLYPAGAFTQEVFDQEAYNGLTPVADDPFFVAQAILKGTKAISLSEEPSRQLSNPEEFPNTQECGIFRAHLRANGSMLYRILCYYDLLDPLKIPVLPHLQCEACRRDIPLIKKGDPFPPKPIKTGKRCTMCLNEAQKKVLVINAAGYGNIGDDMYREVLAYYLGNKTDIQFIPDTIRLSEKGKYIERHSSKKDWPFDVLVVGGGGILGNFSSQDNFYAYYMTLAAETRRPFILASVGFQTKERDLSIDQAREILDGAQGGNSYASSSSHASVPTSALLAKADLILPRTNTDGFLLRAVLGEAMRDRICVRPDLGYLFPATLLGKSWSHFFGREKKYVTLIQTGSVNVNSPTIQRMIKDQLDKFPHSKLMVMNWGGISSPTKEKDFPEWNLFKVNTPKQYPEALIKMGHTLSPKLKGARYAHKPIRESDLTPEEAIEIVSESHFVITGRLHGAIIARALKVPFSTPLWSYKMTAEQESNTNPADASKTISAIREYLDSNVGDLGTPCAWTDNERNGIIVRIAQEHPEWDTSFIQAMDNKSLWKVLALNESILYQGPRGW